MQNKPHASVQQAVYLASGRSTQKLVSRLWRKLQLLVCCFVVYCVLEVARVQPCLFAQASCWWIRGKQYLQAFPKRALSTSMLLGQMMSALKNFVYTPACYCLNWVRSPTWTPSTSQCHGMQLLHWTSLSCLTCWSECSRSGTLWSLSWTRWIQKAMSCMTFYDILDGNPTGTCSPKLSPLKLQELHQSCFTQMFTYDNTQVGPLDCTHRWDRTFSGSAPVQITGSVLGPLL